MSRHRYNTINYSVKTTHRIGVVGNGRVGSAVVELLKNHYNVTVFDPLHVGRADTDSASFASCINDLHDCILTIVCVPTPQSPDGSCDTSLVANAIRTIPTDLILIKSTVQPGTTESLIKETGKRIVFSPEYVGESSYYNPYFNESMRDTPFLILGGNKRDTNAILDIFLPILGPTKTYFQTSAINTEMIKYVENTYFATKVTYVNEIYEICKAVGADWNEVREGWLLDPRVERMHTAVFPLNRGFGGKCYPKDLAGLIAASKKAGYEPKLLQQVEQCNTSFRAININEIPLLRPNPISNQVIKQKTILVTGGAGFIGSHVARRLHNDGYKVIIIDNFNTYYDPTLKENRIASLIDTSISVYRVDITDYTALKEVFSHYKIDRICHLAAQAGVRYSLENPFIYEESNLKGTLNLLQLTIENNVEGFIFASSSSVYGDTSKMPFSENDITDTPVSLYAATKKSTELLVRSYHSLYGLHATGLRYFTVYGPWGRPDMALFKFTKSILAGEIIDVYGNGDMQRDFTYVDDIVEGTVRAIEKNESWEIVNLGYGKPVKLMDFILTIEQCLNKKTLKRFLPLQLGDVSATFADNAKAKQLYQWTPKTSIEIGVDCFVEWYRNYYKV